MHDKLPIHPIVGRAFAAIGLLVGLVPLPPALAAQSLPGTEFVFAPGDQVRIAVWPDSTLSGVFPIEESGLVHIPLLGPLVATGKTVSELRAEVRAGFEKDLQLPVVSLEARFRVSVLGAVRSPGVYWVDPTFAAFELVSLAGGFTDRAVEDGLTISRLGGQTVSLGSLNDQESRQWIGSQLRSGDRLVVPERGRWNWGILLQSLTLVATIVSISVR